MPRRFVYTCYVEWKVKKGRLKDTRIVKLGDKEIYWHFPAFESIRQILQFFLTYKSNFFLIQTLMENLKEDF